MIEVSVAPSDEEAIDRQSDTGAEVFVHDAPPLVLVYMPSSAATAARREPSDEEAIACQFNPDGADVLFHEDPTPELLLLV